MTKTVNGKLDDIGEALAGLIAPDASGMPKIAVRYRRFPTSMYTREKRIDTCRPDTATTCRIPLTFRAVSVE